MPGFLFAQVCCSAPATAPSCLVRLVCHSCSGMGSVLLKVTLLFQGAVRAALHAAQDQQRQPNTPHYSRVLKLGC